MLKKDITFEDLDGNPVTETFYFNLSLAELIEMQASEGGGFEAHVKSIISSSNQGDIMGLFKTLIKSTVGKRSDDGRSFIKNPELSERFIQSDAYSVFLYELLSDPNAASAFIRAVVPSSMAKKVDEARALNISDISVDLFGAPGTSIEAVPTSTQVVSEPEFPSPKKLKDFTDEELFNMPTAEFEAYMRRERGSVPKNAVTIAMMRASK